MNTSMGCVIVWVILHTIRNVPFVISSGGYTSEVPDVLV